MNNYLHYENQIVDMLATNAIFVLGYLQACKENFYDIKTIDKGDIFKLIISALPLNDRNTNKITKVICYYFTWTVQISLFRELGFCPKALITLYYTFNNTN